MYEKQKATPDSHSSENKVDVGEDLQREFDLKHSPKDESTAETERLLRFSNGQIKKLNQELKALRDNKSQVEEILNE